MPFEKLDGIAVPENTNEMAAMPHHDEWRHLFNAVAPKFEQRGKITTEIIEFLWDSYQTLSKEAGGEFLTVVSKEQDLAPKTLTGYLMLCARGKRDLWWDSTMSFAHLKKVGGIRALSPAGRRKVLEGAKRNGWTPGRTGKEAMLECKAYLPPSTKKIINRLPKISGSFQEMAIKDLLSAAEDVSEELPPNNAKVERLRAAIDAVKTASILPMEDL